MSRIPAIDPTTATGATAELFETARRKMGAVPNVLRVLGNSPAALQAYLTLSEVLAGSRFDDDRWGRRWALGEAAYNYGTAHLVGKFSCATSYAEAARMCTDDEATELRRWFAATLEEWRPKVGAGALAHTLPPGLKRVASPWQRDEKEL